MQLERLVIRDFRILAQVSLDPHPRINRLVGDNGAGKSSLLESLKLLARAKLTPQQARDHLRRGAEGWEVGARWREDSVESDAAPESRRAVARWQQRLKLELDHQPVTAVALARQFLVAPIDWSLQRLVTDGPALRRQFMDWAMFHVEPSYLGAWNQWKRTLAQRNRALMEQADTRSLRAWEDSLAVQAEFITERRAAYVATLAPIFAELATRLLDRHAAALSFERGWSEARYVEHLRQHEARDRARRTTLDGPQRADLRFSADEAAARLLSRGQQKLLFAALVLASNRLIQRRTGHWPLLLIDDFDAELAEPARHRLAAEVLAYPGQTWLAQHYDERALWSASDNRMFHVEHGVVSGGVE